MKKFLRHILVSIYKTALNLLGGLGLQKIWPLGAIRDWLSGVVRTYNRPPQVIFRGQTIFLDKNDSLELSVWGEQHPAAKEIKIIEELIKKGDVVVDIGANIGLMTVFMSKAVGGS